MTDEQIDDLIYDILECTDEFPILPEREIIIDWLITRKGISQEDAARKDKPC